MTMNWREGTVDLTTLCWLTICIGSVTIVMNLIMWFGRKD
jgi:hypothetical protein